MTLAQASFGSSKPVAVVTTMTLWHEPPRIRHQVTRQLTRFYNVLYVELPLAAPSAAGDRLERIKDDLLVYRPSGLSWLAMKLRNNLAWFRRQTGRRLARDIERCVRALGYDSAVLVNFQYDFPEIMQSRLFSRRLYLCNDEFQAEGRWWTRAMFVRAEIDVVTAADLCLAVSVPLLQKIQRFTRRAELFLPGHEFELDGVRSDAAPARAAGPIRVCYMGFINNRLRSDWLMALANDPAIRLTLIGPVEGQAAFAALLAHPNVEHIGTLVGEELRRRLAGFDVFIMPYDASQPVVRAITAPNKLFQYLACGRPVVCAALPGLLPLPDKFVYVADDTEQFVRCVHSAHAEDNAGLMQSRLQFSARNTWNVRGDVLNSMLSPGPMAVAS